MTRHEVTPGESSFTLTFEMVGEAVMAGYAAVGSGQGVEALHVVEEAPGLASVWVDVSSAWQVLDVANRHGWALSEYEDPTDPGSAVKRTGGLIGAVYVWVLWSESGDCSPVESGPVEMGAEG